MSGNLGMSIGLTHLPPQLWARKPSPPQFGSQGANRQIRPLVLVNRLNRDALLTALDTFASVIEF